MRWDLRRRKLPDLRGTKRKKALEITRPSLGITRPSPEFTRPSFEVALEPYDALILYTLYQRRQFPWHRASDVRPLFFCFFFEGARAPKRPAWVCVERLPALVPAGQREPAAPGTGTDLKKS